MVGISLKRKYTREYRVGSKRVCKKSFCEMLKVLSCAINSALVKFHEGSLKHKRGGAHNNLSDENKELIVKHIESFPRYISHYRREQSSALYLDPELTLASMYRLFLEKCQKYHPDLVKPPSESSYTRIFHSLGYKIKNLKADTCKTCDVFNCKITNAGPEARKKLEMVRDGHWAKAEALRAQMNFDFALGKEDEKVQRLCYDLEKTFGLPKASTGDWYYCCNFSMFNLDIHDAKTDKGYFHTWKENQAGRGAQEVGSCVIKFLDKHLQPEAEDLILWSDSCGGQNRNRIMCLMLHHWLSKQTKLERITLRFLQSRHSFNLCDTDFGSVEKAMNKRQNVFLPSKILQIMQSCRQSTSFEVVEKRTSDFHSVGNLMKNVTV